MFERRDGMVSHTVLPATKFAVSCIPVYVGSFLGWRLSIMPSQLGLQVLVIANCCCWNSVVPLAATIG